MTNHSRPDVRPDAAARVYRALLHCYPASFRREYGPELTGVFARQRAMDKRPLGIIGDVAMALADIVPNALALHAELLGRDVRHALRAMRRAPMLFGGALFILALGIGANGAVFSILQAVWLNSLPYRDANRVVMLWTARQPSPSVANDREIRTALSHGLLTPEKLQGWRAETRDVLSDLAAVNNWQGSPEAQFDFDAGDHAERLRGSLVTPNFFRVLGVEAAEGRLFSDADERDNSQALVISDAFWKRAFNGDRTIIGKSLTLVTGRPRVAKSFVIAGVLPSAFRFTYPEETEAWVMMPWSDVARAPQKAIMFKTVGRLAPGVTLAQAKARVASLKTALNTSETRPEYRQVPHIEPIREWVIGNTRPQLLLLSAVALLLFIITCTTVANALFIRVTTRQRELALRAALGAEPGRLVRQLLTEGMVLATLGALAGTLLAVAVAPVLRTFVPVSFPRSDEIGVSVWMLAFAALVATLVVLLSALLPAWRAGHVDLVSMLKRAASTASTDGATTRWRKRLVAAQSGIASALLIMAVLLTTSFWRLGQTPLGFDGTKVLTLEMRMLDRKYRDPALLGALQAEMMARIRATPGVLDAGLTSAVPFRGVDWTRGLSRSGESREVTGNERIVDAQYFSVMRIPLVSGRFIDETDRSGTMPVIVLSESYAKRMFGNENPLGQIVDSDPKRTVVGVVADVRYERREREPRPAYYLPSAQEPSELMCVVARTTGNVAPQLLHLIHELDASLPVTSIATIDEIVRSSVSGRRFYTVATVAFALIALTLTVAGLVLIVARSVVERQQELAIRLALGATAGRLVRLVMQHGLAPVAIGTALGVVCALAGARLLSDFLYQVSPRDPLIYGAVALLVATTGGLAALVPALRVGRTAPSAVMRAD